MTYILWTVRIVILLGVICVLNYALPSRDIVRIVGTEVVPVDQTAADGTPSTFNQQRINAQRADGSASVYRNSDTDFGFPWYFKFDTADVQAHAQGFENDPEKPWVIVTHYGWRINELSMFPNAVSIDRATGPDEQLIPWFNIILITILAIGYLLLRRMVLIFWDRRINPVIDSIDNEIDETATWWRRQLKKIGF